MSASAPEVNIMLDLETLGTKPGCKILTLSSCTFSTTSNKGVSSFFDIAIRMDTQDLLKAEPATVDWWANQSEIARKAAFENVNAIVLTKALGRFSDWIAELQCTPVIWSKGATFDAPILAHAYEVYGLDVPWNFRNERCYRTLEAEFKHLVTTPPDFNGTKHTSFADAVYQAKYAQAIFEAINKSKEDSIPRPGKGTHYG